MNHNFPLTFSALPLFIVIIAIYRIISTTRQYKFYSKSHVYLKDFKKNISVYLFTYLPLLMTFPFLDDMGVHLVLFPFSLNNFP